MSNPDQHFCVKCQVWSNTLYGAKAIHAPCGKQMLSKQQFGLIAFAESCEANNFKPSHYYRLTQDILEARAIHRKALS